MTQALCSYVELCFSRRNRFAATTETQPLASTTEPLNAQNRFLVRCDGCQFPHTQHTVVFEPRILCRCSLRAWTEDSRGARPHEQHFHIHVGYKDGCSLVPLNDVNTTPGLIPPQQKSVPVPRRAALETFCREMCESGSFVFAFIFTAEPPSFEAGAVLCR